MEGEVIHISLTFPQFSPDFAMTFRDMVEIQGMTKFIGKETPEESKWQGLES